MRPPLPRELQGFAEYQCTSLVDARSGQLITISENLPAVLSGQGASDGMLYATYRCVRRSTVLDCRQSTTEAAGALFKARNRCRAGMPVEQALIVCRRTDAQARQAHEHAGNCCVRYPECWTTWVVCLCSPECHVQVHI